LLKAAQGREFFASFCALPAAPNEMYSLQTVVVDKYLQLNSKAGGNQRKPLLRKAD
jgi:hypothetical protein